MTTTAYRYRFTPEVPAEEIEVSLLMAVLATESLHGETQVHLDAGHAFDAEDRTCVIDAGTQVGRDLNRLFAGLVRREFGEDAFRVQRAASEVLTSEAAG
jgi:hypothetical protein